MDGLKVGDRLRFAEEKQAYTVKAVCPHGRFAACTKPFNLRRTVLYTMLDLQSEVRGVDNSIGNSLGYETTADCEDAVAQFCSGRFTFSGRRRPIPLDGGTT